MLQGVQCHATINLPKDREEKLNLKHPNPLSQKCSAGHPHVHTMVLDRGGDGAAEGQWIRFGSLREGEPRGIKS